MNRLHSQLFSGDPRLERCLVDDAAHVTLGCHGVFVGKIQYAVLVLQSGTIAGDELVAMRYGRDTAALVLAYKTRHRIINPRYQTKPDAIVGKMSIAALDFDMVLLERFSARGTG